MTGLIWRNSNYLLALVSGLFLVFASVTGAILAFEPMSQINTDYKSVDLAQVSLSTTITALQEKYDEVLELEVTPDDYLVADVFTFEGESRQIFIDPLTGNELGLVKPQSPFFSFITNLHRSLFLKGLGRAFVGIVSFLLFLIAVSGVFLLAQRQGGFKKWFSPVKEKEFNQRYHVRLSRWMIIPIALIAITGVYLSTEKFDLLPDAKIKHNYDEIATHRTAPDSLENIFETTSLAELRKLSFPFSADEEDYFELALKDRELLVHQYSGAVISEVSYPFVILASRWSLKWHTGQGSLLWSVILLLASLSIVFFLYSGLSIAFKRKKKSKQIVSNFTADEAEIIILVGSETRNTYRFAHAFFRELESAGKRVFIADLNEYTTYGQAKTLVVFTATYGDGEAPSNARLFERLIHEVSPLNPMIFAVIGFGSKDYPKFCQFGIKADALLHGHHDFSPILPLHKINEQSETEYAAWIKAWNKSQNMNLRTSLKPNKKADVKFQNFEVINRTPLNSDDNVLIQVCPQQKGKFESGDLLQVLAPDTTKTRAYSIAKVDGDVLLSVKKHEFGKCSPYLCNLKKGDLLKAYVEKNSSFRYPKDAPAVWLIANGTGIAPFLGMIQNTDSSQQLRLFWGGRTAASFNLYSEILEKAQAEHNLHSFDMAFSRDVTGNYVQDLIRKEAEQLIDLLENRGVIMICGSLKMQDGVLEVIAEFLRENSNSTLEAYLSNGQILTDCY